MPTMRFNHMELTLAPGTLDAERRSDIKRFYGDVLGWSTMDLPLLGQTTYYLSPDDGQFILLAESDKPMGPWASAVTSRDQAAVWSPATMGVDGQVNFESMT